jgi:hypothetical protein
MQTKPAFDKISKNPYVAQLNHTEQKPSKVHIAHQLKVKSVEIKLLSFISVHVPG